MNILRHILLLTSVSALVAQAANISIILDNPNQSGNPGDTLNFRATIYNSGPDPVYLNASSPSFGLSAATATLIDNFFMNAPLSVDANSNSGDFDLFDITLSNPFADPAGAYRGSYNLIGGVDSNAADVLDTANFSVTLVGAPPTPPGGGGGEPPVTSFGDTPEPGTFGIAALAILGLAALGSIRPVK